MCANTLLNIGMSTLLVTFGCSWTYGIGSFWYPNMKLPEYHRTRTDPILCQNNSFRTEICRNLGWKNRNFSEGASSNQRQFRLVKEYFTSQEYEEDQKKYDEIVVLHCITSTARNDVYCVESKVYEKLMYTGHPFNKWRDDTAKFLFTDCYDHDNEVKQLDTQMRFFNKFYKLMGIKNIWCDTFNHHNYPNKIDNFLGFEMSNRDLMSQLAKLNGLEFETDTYHFSNWKNDSARTDHLQKLGILNPFSNHPTKEGHKQIADIIIEFIKNNF